MKYLIKMPFSIQFGPQATKFIKKLDTQTKERIKRKLLKLKEDPFPPEVERVENHKGDKTPELLPESFIEITSIIALNLSVGRTMIFSNPLISKLIDPCLGL